MLHCQFLFKILQDDWRNIVRDEEVFCPFCRASSTADDWMTPQQLEYARSVVAKQLRSGLGQAMRLDADAWNRRQPTQSLIRITMKAGDRSPAVFLPSAVVDSMRLKMTCPECSCRYAVIGAAPPSSVPHVVIMLLTRCSNNPSTAYATLSMPSQSSAQAYPIKIQPKSPSENVVFDLQFFFEGIHDLKNAFLLVPLLLLIRKTGLSLPISSERFIPKAPLERCSLSR